MKTRSVLVIFLVISLLVWVFPTSCFATMTDSDSVLMSAVMDGEVLEYGETYEVNGGEELTVNAASANADISFIALYFYEKGATEEERTAAYEGRIKIKGGSFTILIPTATPGTTKVLYIEAVDRSDNGTDNVISKTGWQGIYLHYPED